MNEQEYEKMSGLEKVYWWHIGRRAIIRVILKKYFSGWPSYDDCSAPSVRGWPRQEKNPPLLLDLGCGTGGNAILLKEFGEIIGADSSPTALKIAQKTTGFSKLILINETRLPFEDNIFDCVTLLDVLEHIKNDDDTISECRRVLKPGGSLILTVPAYQWLFSGHDEALDHKRRYLMKNFTKQLSNVGFRVCFKSYAITFLFPLMALYRLTERIFKRKQKSSYVMFPESINNFFISLLKMEALAFKIGSSFPFGTSIIICAKKQLKPPRR